MNAEQVAQMLQQLAQNQQMLQQALERQADVFNQSLTQQANAFTRMEESRKAMSDPKHVGRINSFSGKEQDWTNWSFQFQTWVSTVIANGQEILDWARDHIDVTITPDIVRANVGRFENIQKMSEQMFATLTSLMPTNSEALSIVKNSCKGVGLDAWRRLCKRYGPNNPQTNMHLLRKVLHPTRVTLAQLRAHVESWEEEYRLYREKTGEDISDSMQRVCLMSMCPEVLAQHLDMNVIRLDNYQRMKAEIMGYLESSQARLSAGAAPMDVEPGMGSLAKGKGKGAKGKGKSKGKGKGQGEGKGKPKFEGERYNCGKWGHTSKECWAAQNQKGGKGKGKGKGKEAKEKGRSVL